MSSTATSSPLDGIKEKINSIVEKYPIIDGKIIIYYLLILIMIMLLIDRNYFFLEKL